MTDLDMKRALLPGKGILLGIFLDQGVSRLYKYVGTLMHMDVFYGFENIL